MSNIEWTDETWNPVVGCKEISPGCRDCYAAKLAHRGLAPQHRGLTVVRADGPHWNGNHRFVADALDKPLHWRKPRKIFPCSMSDLFRDEVSDEEIAAVFGVMAACPQHTFQVLTKRPERTERWFEGVQRRESDGRAVFPHDTAGWRIRQMLRAAVGRFSGTADPHSSGDAWPLSNVWIGTTCEDQQRADERLPHLLRVPAVVRFVSYEPALGPVDFSPWLPPVFPDIGCRSECGFITRGSGLQCLEGSACGRYLHPGDKGHAPVSGFCGRVDKPAIDWLIVGGESGHHARPLDLAWARQAVSACKAAGVACFVKQMGARPVVSEERWWADGVSIRPGDRPTARARAEDDLLQLLLRDKKGGDMAEWPEDLRVREFPQVRR